MQRTEDMNNNDLTEKYTLPNYRRYDFWPERGQGAYVWDRDGRKYLDFAGGVAVNPLGHCHPEVVQAIKDGTFDTVIGQVKFQNNVNPNVWTVGQWRDGAFVAVAADGIEISQEPVKKQGWE